MCFWRGVWPIFRFYILLAATVICCSLWMTMDFDADHAVSSASPGCCIWWCRQDACPHETSGSGGRSTSSRQSSSELDFSRDHRQQTNMRSGESNDRLQLQRNQKGFPLCKDPFKKANCCKCCRLLGCFIVRRVCCTHAEKTWGRWQRWWVTHLCSWGEQINTINRDQRDDARRLRGLSPAVHSFNESDMSDLGKRFNGCFLSVFQHSVGGWSNATGQGRHADVRRFKWMFLQKNKHFPEYQSRKVSD